MYFLPLVYTINLAIDQNSVLDSSGTLFAEAITFKDIDGGTIACNACTPYPDRGIHEAIIGKMDTPS